MGNLRLPLRLYFGLLFALVVVGAAAGVVYVDRTAPGAPRADLRRPRP